MPTHRTLVGSLATPLRSAFGGAPALHWPHQPVPGSGRATPAIVLLFIPGNPGLAEYYTPYLSAIHASPLLRGRIEILALSHINHAPVPYGTADAPATSRVYTLREQVEHKVKAVDAIRAAYPSGGGTQLVLMGHSVGSWMALEVLKLRKNEVDAVHILFPTVSWIGKTPNARKLAPLFHPLVPRLLLPLPLLFLSLLPFIILLPIVSFLTRQKAEAARATATFLVTPGAVASSLGMAAEEMREIRKIREDTIAAVEDLKRRRGGKAAVRAYWGRGEEDGWAPSWIRKQTETTLSLSPLSLPPRSSIASPKRQPTRTISISALRARRQSHGTMNAVFGIHQAPSTPPRRAGTTPHKRRPSLVGAVAKRGLDGSITFEAPVGLDDGGSDTERGEPDEDSGEELQGSIGRATSILGLRNTDGGSEIKRTLEGSAVVDSPVKELDLPSAFANAAPGSPRRPANGLVGAAQAQNGTNQAALTSAVCNIGMPHAFCLLHSEAMASISSAWLAQDNL